MRLINTETLELEDFASNDLAPPYAILSHTWGDGEVTFHDWQDRVSRVKKRGFYKIQSTCQQAFLGGYSYAWVDTNCIDKSSSAELSSMFAWYENAAICYVYMPDVISTPNEGCGTQFWESRWFTRGWTLQELIAPENIEFYGRDWVMLGTKTALITVISEQITKIPRECLTKEKPLSSFSIAQKMSWASSRVTTRPEDQAYCVLGLFGVNMPLLYGEGSKAFVRLQEEIVKISDDQSIFACSMEALTMSASMAMSPRLFSRSSQVKRRAPAPFHLRTLPPFYFMTNAGLYISLPLVETLSPHFVLAKMKCMLGDRGGPILLPLSSHLSEYRHQYTRVSVPSAWIALCCDPFKKLLPMYEERSSYLPVDFATEEMTNVMITTLEPAEQVYLQTTIFSPLRSMGARVFFLIVFPQGQSGYRLHAADPPEALVERISMIAMMGKSDADDVGRGLLVFEKRHSGHESGKYMAVYLEASLDEDHPLEERFHGWRHRCRVFPDWNVNDTLQNVPPFDDGVMGERGRASLVGKFRVTVRILPPLILRVCRRIPQSW
ncbi:het domain-containing protein [Colletotrichum asianum]|uniref:Het domain-containing protein n=1 Tax=Colletotrichum asianum TaxID=702518 RepID=A0A8H3WLF6_9PEZI|nr:het domain-containing protein [Colletotrichum asianum]